MSGRSRIQQSQFKYSVKDIKNIIDNKWSAQWKKICYKVNFTDENQKSPAWITEYDVKSKDLLLEAWDDLILQMPESPHQHHEDLLKTQETMQGRYLYAYIYFDVDDSLNYGSKIQTDVIEGWYYFRGHPIKEMIDIPLENYNKKKKTNFKVDDVCCICVHILHVLHHCFLVTPCKKKMSCVDPFHLIFANKSTKYVLTRIYKFINV